MEKNKILSKRVLGGVVHCTIEKDGKAVEFLEFSVAVDPVRIEVNGDYERAKAEGMRLQAEAVVFAKSAVEDAIMRGQGGG